MADIQAALPASFMQVASTQLNTAKGSAKDHAAAGLQLASFFGVLKSQITNQEAALEPLVQGDAAAALSSKAADDAALQSPKLAVTPAESLAESQPETPSESAMPLAMQGNVQNSVASDATVQSAAVVAALGLNIAQEKPSQNAVAESDSEFTESDALLSEDAATKPAKPVLQGKPDALIKSHGVAAGAAIAAVQGQALPLAEVVVAGQTGVPTAADAKLESLVAAGAAMPGLARSDVAASSATPITVTHTFDQALRQAENKIHAAIEAPVRSPAFAAELSDKVVWLATRQGQLAELSLNPPQMGALEVRLTLSGGEASAQFFSANPAVREALDAALPKLRELMAQAGINLGEAEVREQAFGRRDQQETRQQGAVNEAEGLTQTAAMAGNSGRRTSGSGLVDLYI